MPVRIRLQRHGKKGKPFYWIVAADSRSKRDGRYLEKLGVYNPNTNPATILPMYKETGANLTILLIILFNIIELVFLFLKSICNLSIIN